MSVLDLEDYQNFMSSLVTELRLLWIEIASAGCHNTKYGSPDDYRLLMLKEGKQRLR
jgi:hypothetical protein